MANEGNCYNKVDYVPMKLHYFFFNAGLSGILPFLSVYAKQLGISPLGVGIIFTILPAMTMLAKPLVGSIADHTKKLKVILHVLLCMISLTSILIMFIPSRFNNRLSSSILCSSNGTVFLYKNKPLPNCLQDISINESYSCYFSCEGCSPNNNASTEANSNLDCGQEKLVGELKIAHLKPHDDFFIVTEFVDDYRANMSCLNDKKLSCSVTCNPIVHKCYQTTNPTDPETIQFWSFLILVIFSNIPSSICVSLGDAACFNLLGENAHLYGNQRLWGTIGWGVFGLVTGALNSAVTGTSFIRAYYPGFALVAVFLLMDIITIRNVNMDNLILSKSIFRDVLHLLKKANILMFLSSVFIVGFLTSLMWTYLFWHLTTLGASSLILGGISAVQCLVGELPFLYFSKIILNAIGHFNALTVIFLAYGVRFLLYAYLRNPVWFLLVEILQGPSLGLFYATMPTYANIAAPPGTEATMQGLAGGVFEGLGIAVGSFLGGFVMQNYKGSIVFYYGGILSLCYCLLNIPFTIVLYCKTKSKTEKQTPVCSDACESPDEGTSFIG